MRPIRTVGYRGVRGQPSAVGLEPGRCTDCGSVPLHPQRVLVEVVDDLGHLRLLALPPPMREACDRTVQERLRDLAALAP